jgi:hypothetical protein
MVGNDVVDLMDPDADPGTHDARFDTRVFRDAELGAIARSRDCAAMRWSFWAVKEAAYKLCVRKQPAITFSPIRFEVRTEPFVLCRERGRITGSVCHLGRSYAFRVLLRDDWVHAVVTESANHLEDELVSGARRIASDQEASPALYPPAFPSAATPERLSSEVRRFALGELAEAFDTEPAALSLRKHGRVPYLSIDDVTGRTGIGPRLLPLSLSHHGRVVAYAAHLGAAHEVVSSLPERERPVRCAS